MSITIDGKSIGITIDSIVRTMESTSKAKHMGIVP